jgi:hypothetical protein
MHAVLPSKFTKNPLVEFFTATLQKYDSVFVESTDGEPLDVAWASTFGRKQPVLTRKT